MKKIEFRKDPLKRSFEWYVCIGECIFSWNLKWISTKVNGKRVYMFETHPLSFAGKFVFRINKKIDLTITTLRKRTKFCSEYFCGKLKSEWKFGNISKNAFLRNFFGSYWETHFSDGKDRPKIDNLLFQNPSKMKIRKGREIRY